MWMAQPMRPSDDLPSTRPGQIGRQGQRLRGVAQQEALRSAEVERGQQDRPVVLGGHRLGLWAVRIGRVDLDDSLRVRIAQKLATQVQLDTGRLHRIIGQRADGEVADLEPGEDVGVGEDHDGVVRSGG